MPREAGPKTRPSTLSDLPEIERIEGAVFSGDRLSRRSLRRLIASPSAAMLTLTAQGRIEGYALVGFRRTSRKARLYSIALDPSAQGRGYGRLLLAAGEEEARGRGALTLRLEVRDDNAQAIRLYEQAGYRPFGRYEDYYEDGGGAIRFEKPL